MNRELHIVSTGRQPIPEMIGIAKEIHPYIDAFHIREKQKTARELMEIVNQLKAEGVPLDKILINDRLDVGAVTKVKGVQLANHSLDIAVVKDVFPGLRLGCSVHTVEEAIYASECGADYVIYGHIFHSQSKPNKEPRGLEKLKELTMNVKIPVIAIGGIQLENVEQVLEAGAQGIAVLSGVMLANDPVQAVKKYTAKLRLRESPLSK